MAAWLPLWTATSEKSISPKGQGNLFLNSKQHTHRHFFMLSTMMSSQGFSRKHLSTLKDQRVETTCHRHRTPARYLEDNSITFNTVLQLPYSEPNGFRSSPFSQPNRHRNYAKISRPPLKTTVFFFFCVFWACLSK